MTGFAGTLPSQSLPSGSAAVSQPAPDPAANPFRDSFGDPFAGLLT